jgi:transposase
VQANPPLTSDLYRERHRIEDLLARLKAFRRIATRYEKLHVNFAAMVTLACLLAWLKA